jgi:hypothetical protein
LYELNRNFIEDNLRCNWVFTTQVVSSNCVPFTIYNANSKLSRLSRPTKGVSPAKRHANNAPLVGTH